MTLNPFSPLSKGRRKEILEKKTPVCRAKKTFKEVFKNTSLSKTPPPHHKHRDIFDLTSKHEKNMKEKRKGTKKEDVEKEEAEKGDEKYTPHFQDPLASNGIPHSHTSSIECASISSDLSTQAQDLIEKMVDTICIESKKGISTTTVTIKTDNPLSVFNGSELTIEHYDTAPHSFNLQLSGGTQTVDAFTLHLPALQAQLTNRLTAFHIHLLPPILTTNKKFRVRNQGKINRKKEGKKIRKSVF